MKKLLTTIACLLFAVNIYSQGFFKPVDKNLFEMDRILGRNLEIDYKPSVWMFRPQISLAAMKMTFTGDSKVLDVSSFSSMGFGLSYSHFTSVDDSPYNDFSISAALLFDVGLTGVEPIRVSPLISISAYQYLNFGVGFDFIVKKPFILTGINWSFNK